MFLKQKAKASDKDEYFARYGLKPIPKREKEDFVMPSINEEFVPIVEDFVKVMKENFEEEDLQNLYHNLKKLKIKYIKENLKSPTSYEGSYSASKNTIYVKKSVFEDVLYHELLHMASTRIYNGFAYEGFYVANNSYIGRSLNEGYTDLLCERLFNKKVTYNYESLVALALEEIIGEKNMKKYYINYNLYGLINELSNYCDIKNIEYFISYTDLLTTRYISRNHIEYKNELIIGMRENIVKILIKSFVNKNKDKESFLYDYKEYLLFLNCLVSDKEDNSYRLLDEMIDENMFDLSKSDVIVKTIK